MSTQATRLNVQGMGAVTPSNEDLNSFRILTTHLLRLLTLPWSIVSLAELPLNCSTAIRHTFLMTGENDVYIKLYLAINASSNWAIRLSPPFITHTDKRTHTNRHTYVSTPWSKMSCYATSKWLKGNSVPFSLQMITLDSVQCSRNRFLSDK